MPILRNGTVVGTIGVAGRKIRMTETRMEGIAPVLREAAAELSLLAAGSPLFTTAKR
nr:hypothetical protein [Azospirillum sp. 412522]